MLNKPLPVNKKFLTTSNFVQREILKILTNVYPKITNPYFELNMYERDILISILGLMNDMLKVKKINKFKINTGKIRKPFYTIR